MRSTPSQPPARRHAPFALMLFGILATSWIDNRQRDARAENRPGGGVEALPGLWMAGSPERDRAYLRLRDDRSFTLTTLSGAKGRTEARGRWTAVEPGGVRVDLTFGDRFASIDGPGHAAASWEATRPVSLRLVRASGRLHLVPNFPRGAGWYGRGGFVRRR